MAEFAHNYGFFVFLIVLFIFIGVIIIECLTGGLTPFDVKKFIEERIMNDKSLNGEISYKTQIMMTLVDMNAHDSVVLDVERGQHDHTINYFQKNGMTPIQCAEFIQSSY